MGGKKRSLEEYLRAKLQEIPERSQEEGMNGKEELQPLGQPKKG